MSLREMHEQQKQSSPREQLQELNRQSRTELENSLLKEALAMSSENCEELMKQSNQEQVRAEQNRQRDAEQNRKLISELKQSVELLKNSNELLQDAISGEIGSLKDEVKENTVQEVRKALQANIEATKAVSNMAIMDITDIEPLLMAVYELLQESGIFVFATQHPCFVTLTEKYMTPHSYYDIAIEGQPKEQIYYHRSIQDIFNLCFRAGFVIDGFYEECFKTNKEIPMVMIVRLKKVKRDSLK